ncbi:MAG: nucleotidyl transferase AbiEii/AbiGii toxin family protein [Bacteroidota bacterium]
MLFKNTVEIETLFLIEELMQEPLLDNFRLVGGTALSLMRGHRTSDDIDLFTDTDFNQEEIKNLFKTKYSKGRLDIQEYSFGFTFYYTDYENNHDVKIDVMNFSTDPFLEEYTIIDSIRMATLKDIAAMKLNAVKSRRTKKDFIDIYYLLDDFSLEEMLEFNHQRFVFEEYKDALIGMANISEADSDPMPKMFSEITWKDVKEKIISEVELYHKNNIENR